jgi:hypothetical protein
LQLAQLTAQVTSIKRPASRAFIAALMRVCKASPVAMGGAMLAALGTATTTTMGRDAIVKVAREGLEPAGLAEFIEYFLVSIVSECAEASVSALHGRKALQCVRRLASTSTRAFLMSLANLSPRPFLRGSRSCQMLS